MTIAIIGTGNVGSRLAKVLSKTRHGVVFGARSVKKGHAAAEAFLQTHGQAVHGGDIARPSDVVILAVPYGSACDVISTAGDLSGKIVVDATNPLTDDFSSLTLGFETSAAAKIQRSVKSVPVAKAFNTVFAQIHSVGPGLAIKPCKSSMPAMIRPPIELWLASYPMPGLHPFTPGRYRAPGILSRWRH